MPNGKAAGERCVQLSDDYRCRIFGSPERPAVCGKFNADPHVCGETREQAMQLIGWLEDLTVQKN